MKTNGKTHLTWFQSNIYRKRPFTKSSLFWYLRPKNPQLLFQYNLNSHRKLPWIAFQNDRVQTYIQLALFSKRLFVYKYSHYTSNRVSAISHRHMEVPIVLSQSKSLSRAPLADFGVNFILFSIIPLKQKIGNSQSIRNSLESAGCTI